MSIIADALRKAQKDKISTKTPLEETSIKKLEKTTRPHASFFKKNLRTRKSILVIFFITVIAIIFLYEKRTPKPQIILPEAYSPPTPEIGLLQEMPKEELPDLPEPSVSIEPQMPTFTLNGIIYDSSQTGKPMAIINNIIMQEGDTIEDAKLIKIEKDKVVLLFNNEEIVLKLSR